MDQGRLGHSSGQGPLEVKRSEPVSHHQVIRAAVDDYGGQVRTGTEFPQSTWHEMAGQVPQLEWGQV
jgi:hypothetical protein